ncbi:MAG: DNA topoisomerase IB, partial [Salegentibacter sp.]|nr:DNA topoisomerase IB [Salegentibacter sp.]
MTISPEEVNLILHDPYEAANLVNLRYVSEEQLSIKRKKQGRGFSYFKDGARISDKETLQHIKKLVIPPTWSEVR